MHPVSTAACAVVLAAFPLLVMLAIFGPVDGEGDKGKGYWGEKTANVNWCERDYVYTPYIAELGNSLSSLSIVASGVYGIVKHWGAVEVRYILAFGMFAVVGFGSFAFHATLLREWQLADELPMVWGNGVFIFCLATMKDPRGKRRPLLVLSLLAAEILATFAVIVFDESNQDIFLVCYGGGVVYLMGQSHFLNASLNPKQDVVLFETSILFYVAGFLLWLLDRHFCKIVLFDSIPVRILHLHSFWHLGAGIGTFSSVLFWIWTRNTVLGVKQRLSGNTPATRWVDVIDKKL